MNNDLISREALKKAIMNNLGLGDEENGSDGSYTEYMSGLSDCCYLIDNFPTVDISKEIWNKSNELLNKRLSYLERPQSEWIPVSERLPEDMQSVLIWFEYYRYGYYEDGYFNCMYQTYGFGYVCDGKWSPFINGTTGWRDYNVIAWQPLPEPYKKGGMEE